LRDFLLVASGATLLFYRDALHSGLPSHQSAPETENPADHDQADRVFDRGVVEQMERVLPKSQAEISVALQRLTRAGYRNESLSRFFMVAKFLFRWFCA